MGDEKPKFLIKGGKRLDGRKPEDVRPIQIKMGVVPNADGSAEVIFGKTRVIATVYGPRELHPRHQVINERARVRVRYDMMTFSVEDRKRPGPGRRETEISKVLAEALTRVVITEKYPTRAIDVFVTVVQADASTRVAGLNAASLALADAGIPMRDLVVSLSFGKSYDEKGQGHMVVDLEKEEDNWGMGDIAYAVAPALGEVLLLQMDGDVTLEEFKKGKTMADKAALEIYEMQKRALKARYEEGSK
ncbi:MAG: exosome complex exonuclease Rrp41 [Candidatus Altiarchaeota archaeon]|nr:exosome complex exonuclease Rrp41 [Candidatus Altiarchaeota archaeon]